MADTDNKFTWVQTHKQLVEYIKGKRENQKELIELLDKAGVDKLIDEDPKDTRIPLEEIDPLSFFCFIHKHGDNRRIAILQHLAEELDLHIPTDVTGIPTVQPLKVMMFPFKHHRNNDEINKLWDFFFAALNDEITDEQFADIINLYGVGKVKITEALYFINPDKYFPVNGPAKPYLSEELGIDPSFDTYTEYMEIVKQVKETTDRAFYEVSYDSYLWNEEQKKTNYWVFQCNPSNFDVIEALENDELNDWSVDAHIDKIKKGDKVILWVTGGESGCYALCKVASDVYEDDKELSHKDLADGETHYRVELSVTHNLVSDPITKEQVAKIPELSEMNVGVQGTNFKATEKEYNTLLELVDNRSDRKYWLYSPGRGAEKWEEFYNDGVMRIGWDDLGDLRQYNSKEEIAERLREIFDTDSSKKNDATANWDLLETMSIGDVVIAKKGIQEYVGYGIITSDYFYDDDRDSFQKSRKVDWKKKGHWEEPDGQIVTKTLTDITSYDDYLGKVKKLLGIDENGKAKQETEINYPLNTILYGPPGTGKTYHTIQRAAEIVTGRKIETHVEAKEIFNDNLGDTIEFITFHQNYSYEDFIQGLRPDIENNQDLTFERQDGIFKKLADRALKNQKRAQKPQLKKKPFDKVFKEFITPLVEEEVEEIEVEMTRVSYFITGLNPKGNGVEFRKASGGTAHNLNLNTLEKMYEAESTLDIQGLSIYYQPLLDRLLELGKSDTEKEITEKKNYVIVIDEINRANISRVFGELITLIEPDKRAGGTIPLSAKLPSGERFTVPSNLYIIGTMNTADKSVALLDIALRRRFEFEAMYPKYEIDGSEVEDADILKKINKRIIDLKGQDFQIGHSYFMDKKLSLEQRMNKKVIPLLLEYFMNDEDEVKGILSHAGLKVKEDVWPLQIAGRA